MSNIYPRTFYLGSSVVGGGGISWSRRSWAQTLDADQHPLQS